MYSAIKIYAVLIYATCLMHKMLLDWIWQKGSFTYLLNFDGHIYIVTLLNYTGKEFEVPPTFIVGTSGEQTRWSMLKIMVYDLL